MNTARPRMPSPRTGAIVYLVDLMPSSYFSSEPFPYLTLAPFTKKK